MSEIDPAGRVQIVLDPALPSKCIVCDKGPGKGLKFVDFNVSLDWYGAVVFCIDCIKECITVAEHDPVSEIEAKLKAKEEELEVATHELIRYRTAFDGLSFIRPDLNPLTVVNDEQSEDSEKPADEREEDESDSDGSDSVGGLENLSIFTE